MKKRMKSFLVLISFFVLILGGTLIYLAAQVETCTNYDCLGQASCQKGVEEFKGCTKDNPCIGGGSMKCERTDPI